MNSTRLLEKTQEKYRESLGDAYPEGGVPVNPFTNQHGVWYKAMHNVLKDTPFDIGQQLQTIVAAHDYSASKCRVLWWDLVVAGKVLHCVKLQGTEKAKYGCS
jgi:hypothetical protein